MNNTINTINNISLQARLTSQGNKKILWEIMTENNIFNGIADTYVNNVKTDFERILTQISGTIEYNDTILDLNKQVILRMIDTIKVYSLPKGLGSDAKAVNNIISGNIPLTSAEVSTQKQNKFQKGLQTRQEEFTSLIQPVKPQTIDFSDKLIDEPIGSEMDIKLAQTIAWREKQLSQVLEKQDTNAASEWISNGKNITSTSSNTNTNNRLPSTTTSTTVLDNHIKIGSETNIDEQSIINIKKVSFAEVNDTLTSLPFTTTHLPLSSPSPSPLPMSFMDKLKKKDSNEDNTLIKTDIGLVKTDISFIKMDIGLVKTDISFIKTDIGLVKTDIFSLREYMNTIIEQNKLLIENQDKIMDMLIK